VTATRAADAHDRLSVRALVGALALLVGTGLIGLLIGPVRLPAAGVVRALADHLPFLDLASGLTARDTAILEQLRAPRVVLGGLVGAALAVAGGTYQGVFANPLADPYLLGVAAGAGLGVTFVIVSMPDSGPELLPPAAFLGAVLAVALTLGLGRSGAGSRSVTALVLAGVTVSAFLTALQTSLQQWRFENLQRIYSFILGGLGGADWARVRAVVPYLLVGAVTLACCGRRLDVLAVGDEEARALGIRAGAVRLVVVAAATLLTGAAVASAGLIGFVGILVPHAVRLLTGLASTRLLLPLCGLAGAAFMIGCDVLARTVLAPAELPIGVVTAFFGAPFFLWVLRWRRLV
jgi:iron complex transport system permease protein